MTAAKSHHASSCRPQVGRHHDLVIEASAAPADGGLRGRGYSQGEMVRFTLVPDQRGIGSGPYVAGNRFMSGRPSISAPRRW